MKPERVWLRSDINGLWFSMRRTKWESLGCPLDWYEYQDALQNLGQR